MPLNITAIQDKLYEWVFDETALAVIWLFPNAPRPDLPYISLNILNFVDVHQDFIPAPDPVTGEAEIAGNREFTLSIQCYGDNALQTMSNLKDSLEKPSIQVLLREENIAFVDSENVINVTTLLDSIFEERAALDVRFRVATGTVDEIGIIEQTNIETDIKDPVGNTINSDTINIS